MPSQRNPHPKNWSTSGTCGGDDTITRTTNTLDLFSRTRLSFKHTGRDFKLSDDFEVQGEFWLPGHENHPVAGILTFTNDSGGRLALIGSLETEEEIFRNISREHHRINGNDGSDLYTLDDCFRTNSQIIGPQLARRQTYYVGRIIKGISTFNKDDDVNVCALAIQMFNQLDWLQLNGIEEIEHFANRDRTTKEWEIVGTRHPSLTARFHGGKITFGHQLWRSDQGIHGLTIHQDSFAKLSFDRAIPLDESIEYAGDLRDLISIATTRVAAFKSVHLYHPAFEHEKADGTRVSQPAELVMDWIAKPQRATRTLTTHDMLFTFDQLGGTAGIERWMPVALRYRSILGRVMNTIYTPFMFTQDKLLHRIAALESFHRLQSGIENGVYLANRLRELAAFAGEPFRKLLNDDGQNEHISKWCAKAKDERNEVAHHLGRQPQDSATLFYISQAAYWLLVICLLREAEAPDIVFEHMMSTAIFDFESCEIQNILR
jgi:hypothetical protein